MICLSSSMNSGIKSIIVLEVVLSHIFLQPPAYNRITAMLTSGEQHSLLSDIISLCIMENRELWKISCASFRTTLGQRGGQ